MLSPEAVAILPSRLMPVLIETKGRLVLMYLKKRSLSLLASSASTPTSTSRPAARRRWMPLPATSGLASSTATTTRETPLSSTRSAQGGVRPWWAHGSSVT
ncbi:hypothetical protein D3C72_1953390 [compost metagenome]